MQMSFPLLLKRGEGGSEGFNAFRLLILKCFLKNLPEFLLQSQANRFNKAGSALKDKMFWAALRAKLIFIVIGAVVVIGIIGAVCGSSICGLAGGGGGAPAPAPAPAPAVAVASQPASAVAASHVEFHTNRGM